MHSYRPSTSGERLCQYVHKSLEDERAWNSLLHAIRPVGDCNRLIGYYRHHAALFLTCKLISAGKSVTRTDQGNIDLLTTIIDQFPWNRLNSGNRLLRLLSDAVRYSNRPISPGTASLLMAYAKERHSHCYICGTSLEFYDPTNWAFYTAEHLWPSSYGGDSVEENLLPACRSCNSRKGNIATWVSTDVHSLFMGMNPDRDHLSMVSFPHRYAIFHRAALTLAISGELTLKRAFLKIGPWDDLRVHDSELAADMFNLRTHQELEDLENYEEL